MATNPYYDHPNSASRFQRNTLARADDINTQLDAISAGFDLINQEGFSASLPGQAGNAGKVILTNGTDAVWSDIDLGVTTLTGTLAQFNTALSDDNFVSLTGLETLTNKTLTSPIIGTAILDTNGNELVKFTATGSAVNEITLTNAASGGKPTISATGGGTDVSINLVPKGAGTIQINGAAALYSGGALGTPSAGTLTSCTGLPVSTGISGLGSGVAAFLATPSSANLATAVTGETGSGALVFGTSPAIATPTITGTKETKVAMGASAIDLTAGNYFTKTIVGTTTLTISGAPTSPTVAAFILELTNGGAHTVNWFSGDVWASGVAPTLTAAGRDVIAFYTHDGGTTWNGFVLGQAMA